MSIRSLKQYIAIVEVVNLADISQAFNGLMASWPHGLMADIGDRIATEILDEEKRHCA